MFKGNKTRRININVRDVVNDETAVVNKKYVDQIHITPSGPMKDSFRYLMEDVNESSSENNITVLDIFSFSLSPHQINRKVYRFTLTKYADSDSYRSRIGFNLGSLATGYYTFVTDVHEINHIRNCGNEIK